MARHSLFPFCSDYRADFMQRRVVSVIQDPQFVFELPSLSSASWDSILNSKHRMERLEFLGDALIGASISEELFRCWPNEGPGFYTKARQVLVANSTFAHIMLKLGFHHVNHPVKPAGDAFETILATYHSEQGPAAFTQYVRKNFQPMVSCIGHAYHESWARGGELKAKKARVQLQRHLHQASNMHTILGNVKSHRKHKHESKLANVKKNIQKTLRREVWPPPNGVPQPPAASSSLTKIVKSVALPRVLVDLTLDSDDEDSALIITTPTAAKPMISIENLKTATAMDRSQAPLIRSELKPGDESRHLSILRSISISPRVRRRAGSKSLLAGSYRNNTNVDQVVSLLSKTSLEEAEIGTANNPITID